MSVQGQRAHPAKRRRVPDYGNVTLRSAVGIIIRPKRLGVWPAEAAAFWAQSESALTRQHSKLGRQLRLQKAAVIGDFQTRIKKY